MRSKDERIYERMIELSWRIARFREESDPYGFKDALEPGESVEDGVRRTANEAYGLLGQQSRRDLREVPQGLREARERDQRDTQDAFLKTF